MSLRWVLIGILKLILDCPDSACVILPHFFQKKMTFVHPERLTCFSNWCFFRPSSYLNKGTVVNCPIFNYTVELWIVVLSIFVGSANMPISSHVVSFFFERTWKTTQGWRVWKQCEERSLRFHGFISKSLLCFGECTSGKLRWTLFDECRE